MRKITEFFEPPIMRLCLLIALAMTSLAAYSWIPWASMEGATWAAWVQAFGSIAAILAAIFIMNHQHETARSIAEESTKSERASLIISGVLYGIEISTAIRTVHSTTRNSHFGPPSLVIYVMDVLGAARRQIELVPSWRMNVEEGTPLNQLKRIANEAHAEFKMTLEEQVADHDGPGKLPRHLRLGGIAENTPKYLVKIAQETEKLRVAYGTLMGVPCPV